MGFIRKTITLTELLDRSVKTQVDELHNSNDRECSAEMESTRTALIQGEASRGGQVF